MVDADRSELPAAEAPSILTKAFDLLRAFDSENRVMTLSELARASGLPKSTVHRILARLIELGAIEHHRSAYRIGLDMLRIGSTTPAGSMRELVLPYLASLHSWSGQAVHFGVLRQFDVVYLEKVAPPNASHTPANIGGRVPANCTAIGKALLAFEDPDDLSMFLPSPMPRLSSCSITSIDVLMTELRQIRQGGLAREHDEVTQGFSSIAAPVIVNGFAIAGLAIGYRTGTTLDPNIPTAMRNTAAQISRDIRAALADGRTHWFP